MRGLSLFKADTCQVDSLLWPESRHDSDLLDMSDEKEQGKKAGV